METVVTSSILRIFVGLNYVCNFRVHTYAVIVNLEHVSSGAYMVEIIKFLYFIPYHYHSMALV